MNKVGDYITYKVKYAGSDTVFHANGTIEKIIDKNGKTEYLVAEGNGGQNMTYVDPNSVVTLLNE
jgi:hypothetical protein|tara:strand:- start:1116 stop:1310 length:195 start_codon:yes stop_codon:yes gene_type:complete